MIPFIVVVEPKGQRCRTDVVLVRGDRPKTDEEVASTLVEADRLLERGDPRGEALLALLHETPYITVHPHPSFSDPNRGWPELQIHNVLIDTAKGGVEAGLRLLMGRLDVDVADYAVAWTHAIRTPGQVSDTAVQWRVTVRQMFPIGTTHVATRHTDLIASRQLNEVGLREVIVVRVGLDAIQVTTSPRRLSSSFPNSQLLQRRETDHVQLAQEDDVFFTE